MCILEDHNDRLSSQLQRLRQLLTGGGGGGQVILCTSSQLLFVDFLMFWGKDFSEHRLAFSFSFLVDDEIGFLLFSVTIHFVQSDRCRRLGLRSLPLYGDESLRVIHRPCADTIGASAEVSGIFIFPLWLVVFMVRISFEIFWQFLCWGLDGTISVWVYWYSE